MAISWPSPGVSDLADALAEWEQQHNIENQERLGNKLRSLSTTKFSASACAASSVSCSRSAKTEQAWHHMIAGDRLRSSTSWAINLELMARSWVLESQKLMHA